MWGIVGLHHRRRRSQLHSCSLQGCFFLSQGLGMSRWTGTPNGEDRNSSLGHYYFYQERTLRSTFWGPTLVGRGTTTVQFLLTTTEEWKCCLLHAQKLMNDCIIITCRSAWTWSSASGSARHSTTQHSTARAV